jgi:hypothetical protein
MIHKMQLPDSNQFHYSKLNKKYSLLGQLQTKITGEENGFFESSFDEVLFIRPAGYSQPINLYPPYQKYNQQIVNKNKEFLSRRVIYDGLFNSAHDIYKRKADYLIQVELIAEPNNRYDNNAVAVIITKTSPRLKKFQYCHLGYVPKIYSQLIKQNLYRISYGEIYNIYGSESPYCATVIFKIDETKNLVSQRFRLLLED